MMVIAYISASCDVSSLLPEIETRGVRHVWVKTTPPSCASASTATSWEASKPAPAAAGERDAPTSPKATVNVHVWMYGVISRPWRCSTKRQAPVWAPQGPRESAAVTPPKGPKWAAARHSTPREAIVVTPNHARELTRHELALTKGTGDEGSRWTAHARARLRFRLQQPLASRLLCGALICSLTVSLHVHTSPSSRGGGSGRRFARSTPVLDVEHMPHVLIHCCGAQVAARATHGDHVARVEVLEELHAQLSAQLNQLRQLTVDAELGEEGFD
mmetsp:Transcript_27101/g.73019  ORF Transcript_27101/g.73019 Transcript_27101/m.73019 type:complete len:273 (+) Transcript_27101:139-957(+)